ncbi:MAG: SpoIIE family protein phosphatase [Nocardioidaceae bacterium]
MPLRQLPPEVERMFAAGGAMGALMREVDWAATPVGAPGDWPQSLRTAVSVCLESRFPLLIWWGPELVMLYNDAYKGIIGSKHPRAMGQRGADCWPEIWETIAPMLSRVLAGKGATYSEDQLLRLVRHGFPEECYFTFSYSPIRDESGGVGGVFTAVTETSARVIGARRLATLRSLAQRMVGAASVEEVLAAAAEVLDTAAADVPCAVVYRLTDQSPERIASTGGLTPDDLSTVEQALGGALVDPAQHGTVVPLPGPLGPLATRSLLALPVEAGGTSARLVVGISPALLLDDDYRSFLSLVAGQVSVALSEALGYEAERARATALAELDRAKTAFFANISHEFRTPLTLILGPTEDALGDPAEPLGDRQRPRTELVRRNALRLLKLVNTLLDFSRLESGRARARYEPVELGAFTADLASVFRSAVETAGLRYEVDCPPVREPVFVDREMWEKIVLNLVSNALKFTFDGSIGVRLREGADTVTLCVEDTGVGIEPKDQPSLFERFHRLQGNRSRTFEGSGIGLALVAEAAELHGGGVSVRSAPDEGSTFTVTVPFGTGHLPAEQVVQDRPGSDLSSSTHTAFVTEALRWVAPSEPGSAPEPERAEADHGTAAATTASGPRVLVVDDNADIRDYVTGLLADDYRVETAPDGRSALEAIRRHPPDLVLSDVMMPHLDGFGLLAALREDPRTAALPVIMLSARAGEEAAVEGLDAGAHDYHTKPFGAREHRARVRAVLALETMRLERGRDRAVLAELETSRAMLDQAQELARVGSWELDLATGRVTASAELSRQLQLSEEELSHGGLELVLRERVHPDDVERVRSALDAGAAGEPVDYEVRIVLPDGAVRRYRTLGVAERDAAGRPVRLVGSNQDITDQREVERVRAAELAAREVAAREHSIADTLQHSLLPTDAHRPGDLDVASFYLAGTEGTQVGGDWYDVIDLGADRTGLVIGDVMGRGVRAAAVMGQLRAAIRAYARLDLAPDHLLEQLDGVVRDFGDDQIVTCVYAVYDPAERRLTYANAGHLPPLLMERGGHVRLLTRSLAPPLGTGQVYLEAEVVHLHPGATLTLYTDGLVERRDSDIDAGVQRLSDRLAAAGTEHLDGVTRSLVGTLDASAHDDDVALLMVRTPDTSRPDPVVTWEVRPEADAVHKARRAASRALRDWALPQWLVDDVTLVVSEMVTNALRHGRPPVSLRLRRARSSLVLEVWDGAAFLPRRLRPTPEDEGGRGVQLMALLADRWGARPLSTGKATWCIFRLAEASVEAPREPTSDLRSR